MIRPTDISIVVQGAVSPDTIRVVQQLQRNFCGAEIIISTWLGSDLKGIYVEKIVQSDDPGCVVADFVTQTMNNINRQLVSTKAGIAAATRPFILKTRTDIVFHSADFLKYFEKYDAVQSTYFRNRLLLCNYYTRNPRVFGTCFHPSDWILFGRAEDIRTYYNGIPLMPEEEGGWFLNHSKDSTFFTNYICRYTPEQHIFLSFLNKKQNVHCSCYYDRTPEMIIETECAFAECFVVLDYQNQIKITFPKYNPNRYLEKYTLISHWQWKALYMHYCKSTPSILWFFYLIRSHFLVFCSTLRTICVLILDRLNLKETVKKILSTKQKKQH